MPNYKFILFIDLLDIRLREQFLLEISAFIRSFSDALCPVIPIIAVIVTFLAYTAVGNDHLSTAKVRMVIFLTITLVNFIL